MGPVCQTTELAAEGKGRLGPVAPAPARRPARWQRQRQHWRQLLLVVLLLLLVGAVGASSGVVGGFGTPSARSLRGSAAAVAAAASGPRYEEEAWLGRCVQVRM